MLDDILRHKRLIRFFPNIGWAKSYERKWLREYLVSGLMVGMIMIPVAMSYAQMAGASATLMLLSSALALTMDIILLVLSLAKLGFISDFLAKSVMTGYVLGIACLIVISQLPQLLNVSGGSGSFFNQLSQFISKLLQTNL